MLLYVSGFDEDDYKVILGILLSNLAKNDVQSTKNYDDKDYYGIAINSLWGTALVALIRLGLKANELKNGKILNQVKDLIRLIKNYLQRLLGHIYIIPCILYCLMNLMNFIYMLPKIMTYLLKIII